jgi:hypothetical protein
MKIKLDSPSNLVRGFPGFNALAFLTLLWGKLSSAGRIFISSFLFSFKSGLCLFPFWWLRLLNLARLLWQCPGVNDLA